MEAPPIHSALLLTTTWVFDRPGAPAPPSPLTRVGGLSLVLRTILTLQRGGVTRIIVLGGAETGALRRQLQGDPRVQAEVRWLPVREFPPSDPRTWEVLASLFSAPYLVVGTSAVFPVSLVARVREEGRKGEPVVVMRDAVLRQACPEHSRGSQREQVGGEAGGVVTVETAVTLALNVNLVLIPEGFVSPGWASPQDSPQPLQAALERGVRQGQVKVLPLEPDWYREVAGGTTGVAESIEEAEWALLRSLKGGLEGYVDRHFNRKCSQWITQFLVHTPLTPNAVTYLATVVGLLAAGAFAMGGYTAGVLGALLFQLSAILDCCDGEVARLKFLESRFGEQLDVALDNVVHIALYAGMAWAASQAGWGLLAWLLGGLATVGNVVAFVVVQKAIRMKAALDPGRKRLVEALLNRLVSRDFSVLILALALIGHVEWFLILAAIGSNIFWPTLAWQLRASSAPAGRSS